MAEQLCDPPETEIVPSLELEGDELIVLEGDELNEIEDEPVRTRPQRIRRAPERFTYSVKI